MSNSAKLRLLYIFRDLFFNTDPDHPKTTAEITAMLKENYGIEASRNTISDDLISLRESDFNIEFYESTQNKYYYNGRQLEVSELRILIDALSAAKFITEGMTQTLIDKVIKLSPLFNREKLMLKYQPASDWVKSDSMYGYYGVDVVNEAISSRKRISFRYADYDMHMQNRLFNDGEPYVVSPYEMVWDGEFYYVRGYCHTREQVRNFRMDRLAELPVILDGCSYPVPADYLSGSSSRSRFRMNGDETVTSVKLLCAEKAMKYLIDHFGKNFETGIVDEEHFIATVEVCLSPTFYRWVFGYAGLIKIISPEPVVEEFKQLLKKATEDYE